MLKEHLSIAVTHNIESLTSDLYEKQFFDTLIEIVKTSSIKFDNLKTLMVSPDIGGPYRKLSLQFVDSIETMKADFVEEVDWDCVAQLTQFKKVKTFALKGVLDNFDIMEQILSNCPPEMQTVTLTTFGFDSASTWEQEITKKCYGVTKFTILHGMITIELLNYELYKFANLDTIVIYFVLFRELHDMNMHRIPTIISKVPHWDVVFFDSS